MIVRELADYVQLHGRASLCQLAQQFATTPSAIEAMLQPWLRNGRIVRHDATLCRQGCCTQARLVFYSAAGA
ncbi:MAG: FeoC-like transcriptional regulator [Aeromonas sp.]